MILETIISIFSLHNDRSPVSERVMHSFLARPRITTQSFGKIFFEGFSPTPLVAGTPHQTEVRSARIYGRTKFTVSPRLKPPPRRLGHHKKPTKNNFLKANVSNPERAQYECLTPTELGERSKTLKIRIYDLSRPA